MHVPLIMAGKGIPKNQKVEAFTYLFDMFPTLCAYVGMPQPLGIDGKNILHIVQRKGKPVRSYILNAYMDFQRSVRDERYKLIRYPAVDYTLLFDLQNDPYELVNLANKPEHAGRIQELLSQMKVQQQLYGDDLALTTTKILPLTWDYRTIIRKPDQWQPDYLIKKYFEN